MAFGVDDPSASVSMPIPSPAVTNGWFQPGNPVLNQPATTITVDWLNAVAGEIQNAVIALGGTPDKTQVNQLATGLTALKDHLSYRNVVQNGLFRVNQRGTGAISTTQGNPTDRWATDCAGTGTRAIQRYGLTDADRTQIGDEDARWALAYNFQGTAGAADHESIVHRIESVTTLAGKTATLSFWANIGVGLKMGAEIFQYCGSGGGGYVYGIGLNAFVGTGTWQRYTTTVSIPSVQGKTFGTAGDDALGLVFWMSAGANSNFRAAGIGVQTGFVALWGVQLEVGTTATPLEKPPLAVELAVCQRFYQSYPLTLISGYGVAGGNLYGNNNLAVPMRAVPTVTYSNALYSNCAGVFTNGGNASLIRTGVQVTATGPAFAAIDMSLTADL